VRRTTSIYFKLGTLLQAARLLRSEGSPANFRGSRIQGALRGHLCDSTAFLSDKHTATAQAHYSKYYNKYAAEKRFQAGEQVVVLDKDSTHKTFARWQLGTIARVRSPYSYDVEMADGSTWHLHANKIRKFIARVQGVGVVNEQDEDFGPTDCVTTADPTRDALLPSQCVDSEQLKHLSPEQRTRLLKVLDDFSDCFTETPGHIVLLWPMKFMCQITFGLKRRELTKLPCTRSFERGN